MTSNLVKRIWEQKNNLTEGFTKRYKVHHLVWYEMHENMDSAIQREKRVKGWKRAWKFELIENTNPKELSENKLDNIVLIFRSGLIDLIEQSRKRSGLR